MPDIFAEFALVLGIAVVFGALGAALRQPLIVAFIAAGIVIGPSGLDLVTMKDEMQLLATVGISLLLFLVGLRLDPAIIRSTGSVALATGLGQVAFTSIVGFFICLAMGMTVIASTYVAVALTFSSTIIIVKLLSDKREIDSLHGRIAVGFLIVQDIVVVLAMIALSAIGAAEGNSKLAAAAQSAVLVIVNGLGLLAAIVVLMKYVLPTLVHRIARSQELLVLTAITWAVVLATVGDLLGFSREVGAFLAGISLAPTPFRETLSARLVSVRDFLLLFFFLHLGASLEVAALGARAGAAAVLSAFVLIGNPLIVLIIMGGMGYRRRTSFLAGLTVAQISEFSLILAALGHSLGHIDTETLGLVTVVGLVTIALSTYMIIYSHRLYDWLSGPLRLFERRTPFRESADEAEPSETSEYLLIGLGRYGGIIADELRSHEKRTLGVDFDPEVVSHWNKRGRPAIYGDATDPEFAAGMALQNIRWIICAIPDYRANVHIVRAFREVGYSGGIAVNAHHKAQADALQAAGADLILNPFHDAAKRAVSLLLDAQGTETTS